MAINLKRILQGGVLLSTMTLILGGVYPFSIYVINQYFFSKQANNSLMLIQNKIMGSVLLGQSFSDPKYFWGRPQAGEQRLRIEKYNQLQNKNGLPSIFSIADFPPDFISASGSGVDPHISYQSAMIQLDRVTRETGRYRGILENYILLSMEPRQYFFMGKSRVNVVKLNLLIYENQ
jgi:K+-transporting ATPase ATPase C chain